MELPALLGGPAVRPEGSPPWPPPDPEVHDALVAAWRDGSWGLYHGGHCARLEQTLRDYFQVDHVLLCGSGTFAVELGLRALGVGPTDEVVLAAYDYPGNFLGVHVLGAIPVLVDIEPGNWNLALDNLDKALGARTKAILVSHLHGGLVPMPAFMAMARARGFKVLEDAAQCPGARVAGRKAGTWGDAGVLSFGGSKLLSAGRGGALLTSQADVAQRARVHLQRGNNLVNPLSELQAAVLAPQWAKLDGRHQNRLDSVRCLESLIQNLPGLRLFVNSPGDHQPGFYKVGLQFDECAFGLDRSRFVAAVRAEGIAMDEGFSALQVGRSPRRYRAAGLLTEAERAHRGTVILHHPVLLEGPKAMEQIAQGLRKIHEQRQALRAWDLPGDIRV